MPRALHKHMPKMQPKDLFNAYPCLQKKDLERLCHLELLGYSLFLPAATSGYDLYQRIDTLGRLQTLCKVVA